jgi:hypothetical protein
MMKKLWIKISISLVVICFILLIVAPSQIFACGFTDLKVTEGDCSDKTTVITPSADWFSGSSFSLKIFKHDGTSYVLYHSWSGTIDQDDWEKAFDIVLPYGDYKVRFYVTSTCKEIRYFSMPKCIEYSPAGYVKILYNKILWRSHTADEKQAWLEKYAAGATASQMVKEFIFGEELKERLAALTNEEFLDFLYGAMLLREGDTEGNEAWLARMAAGMTREEVVDGFSASEEFMAIADKFKTTP